MAKVKLVCEKRFAVDEGVDVVALARLFVEELGGQTLEIVTDGDSVIARYTVILKKNM